MKNIINTLKYKFEWLSIYKTPLPKPKWKIQFGYRTFGTPYFLPRRWKKYKGKVLIEEAKKRAADEPYDFALDGSAFKVKDYEHWLRELKYYSYAVPTDFHIDLVAMGWKTKFDDYRFEWEPRLIITLFGWQMQIIFYFEDEQHWENFLEYKYGKLNYY